MRLCCVCNFFLLLLTLGIHSVWGFCESCTKSCCEVNKGDFRCCPFVNGVCCADGESCCPQGSACAQDGLSCTFPNGVIMSKERLTNENQKSKQLDLQKLILGTPTICPDGTSACPANSTCCLMAGGSYGCCDSPNAVCCSDELHCCPHGSKCNVEKGGCDPIVQMPLTDETDKFLSLLFQSQLGRTRTKSDRLHQRSSLNNTVKHVWNATSSPGVQCDDAHVCPDETTCCRDEFGAYACCPFPRAVCCADKSHCCPENYDCDDNSGQCLFKSQAQTKPLSVEQSTSKDVILKDEQLCPDGRSRCPYSQTCCKLADESWGCCPLPEAVCCPDGLHCCPSGYKCNMQQKTCVKNAVDAQSPPPPTPPNPPAPKITCPNEEFQCNNKSTCCPLPNDEWACCPFLNAVCCSDGLHCCPHGTKCDGVSGMCLPVRKLDELPESIPWMKKFPALQSAEKPAVPEQAMVPPAQNNTCEDSRYSCKAHQACCPLVTGGFGCCPFANGTCCSDRRHCCPANTSCDPFGQCVRQLSSQLKHTLSAAFQMQPTLEKSSLPSTQPILEGKPGAPVHAEWCGGLCPNGGFCCADALGQPRRMCCPATAGVCCSDGEHCCPRGTRCIGNGQCQSEGENIQKSSAPYLVPAMDKKGATPDFVKGLVSQSRYHISWAMKSTAARVNPMFLLDFYYRMNAQKFSVCPDLERTCGLEEQCCPSFKNRYVCAPKATTCCPYTADTYCPSGTTCSQDGQLCMPV